MMTRRAVLLLALGLLVSGSPVFAGGGGGTKRSSTIKFVNDSTTTVGVTTNANSSAIIAALNAASLSQFTAAGGKVLNPGATATFSVQAGNYTVGAADLGTVGTSTTTTINPITETITVAQGQTYTIYILSTPTGSTNTIEFSSTP